MKWRPRSWPMVGRLRTPSRSELIITNTRQRIRTSRINCIWINADFPECIFITFQTGHCHGVWFLHLLPPARRERDPILASSLSLDTVRAWVFPITFDLSALAKGAGMMPQFAQRRIGWRCRCNGRVRHGRSLRPHISSREISYGTKYF